MNGGGPDKTPVRLGLIGAGRWGRNVIRTLRALPGATLAAVASANPETRDLVDADCEIYETWQALLERTRLDGYVIATPAEAHAEIAGAVLSRGIPAFIEKPLTLDPLEAEGLIAAAHGSGAWAVVDHIHLFTAAFAALLDALPEIGPVTHIEAEAGNRAEGRVDAGALWDWGPHDVAMALAVMGVEPLSAKATPTDEPMLETALAMTFPGGVRFEGHFSSRLESGRRRFTVQGERGALRYVEEDGKRLCLIARAPDAQPDAVLLDDTSMPLTTALAAFADGIGGVPPRVNNLEFGARVVRILASAETAR